MDQWRVFVRTVKNIPDPWKGQISREGRCCAESLIYFHFIKSTHEEHFNGLTLRSGGGSCGSYVPEVGAGKIINKGSLWFWAKNVISTVHGVELCSCNWAEFFPSGHFWGRKVRDRSFVHSIIQRITVAYIFIKHKYINNSFGSFVYPNFSFSIH